MYKFSVTKEGTLQQMCDALEEKAKIHMSGGENGFAMGEVVAFNDKYEHHYMATVTEVICDGYPAVWMGDQNIGVFDRNGEFHIQHCDLSHIRKWGA